MAAKLAANIWPGIAGLAACLFLLPFARGETLALIVGVNECPDYVLPDGTRPRPLQGAQADAADVAKLLEQHYGVSSERIRMLLGSEATLAKIQMVQRQLSQLAREDDILVFYFAGHGTQLKDVRPLDEEDRRDEAFCLADASSDGQNMLRDDQLGRWLEEIPCGRVTAILDCCHAGTGIKEAAAELAPRFLPSPQELLAAGADETPWLDLQPTAKSGGKRIVALFACRPDQLAYERRPPAKPASPRRGQFTASLLAGLQDAAADADSSGQISHAEALQFARGRLDEAFNKHRENETDRQTPQLSGPGDQPLFWMSETTAERR